LGQEPWDAEVSDLLAADNRVESVRGANARNRIREIGMPVLLLYNGMDSLLEYHVAMKQMEVLQCSFKPS
jgi:hypothetical protein